MSAEAPYFSAKFNDLIDCHTDEDFESGKEDYNEIWYKFLYNNKASCLIIITITIFRETTELKLWNWWLLISIGAIIIRLGKTSHVLTTKNLMNSYRVINFKFWLEMKLLIWLKWRESQFLSNIVLPCRQC